MKSLKRFSILWILLLSVISISFATSPNLSPVSLLQEMLDKSYDGQLIVLPANVDEKLVIRRAVSLMTASPSVVKSLVIDAPGKTVKLLGNLTITENLDVESGFLDAGIYQLNYAHSKGLVKANSAAPPPPPPGSLTLTVPTSGTVAFPIGTLAGYTPVTVSATGAHMTDDLTASVVDRANLSEFTAPTPNGPRFAKFEWTVTEALMGDSEVNLKFGFPTDPNNVKNSVASIGKNDGASWTYQNTTVSGSGPYETSNTGPYTSFSTFGAFGMTPVHNITQGFDYATIQEAIDAAMANDVILCDAGSYTENINIHKPIILTGPNVGISGTGVRGAEAILLNCTIDINNAGNTTLDGLHILRNDGAGGPVNQIELDGGGINTVQNCIFERNGSNTGQEIRAIATTTAGGNKIISNNKIFGDPSGGLFGGHKSWARAIYVDQGAFTVSFTGNTVLNCRTGMNIDDMNNSVTVSGNTINNNGTHISFGGAAPTTGSYVLGANDFINNVASTMINLSNVAVSFRLDITSSTLSGVAFTALTNAQLFEVEARMLHKEVTVSKKGKVTYVANTQYVNNFSVPVVKIDVINNSVKYAEVGNIINLQAGTYNQRVVIDKSLTLQGVESTKSLYIINGTGLPPNGAGAGSQSGIVINSGITNCTIKDLTVQNFTGAGGNSDGAIYALLSNNNLTINNVALLNNPTASGFYANGPVDNVSVTNSMLTNNGGGARGMVIWNGLKTNINFSNNTLTNNTCCGIELSDGNASAVTVSGNTIDIGTGDNAIGLLGLNNSVGNNFIQNNIITGGGRYGIEIKNPAGGVTVSGNSVTLTTINADARDRAGIAVFRRSVGPGNIDVPNGVTITSNTVDGYVQTLPEEGFGIVIEGTNHTVTGNTIKNSNIGIQQQGGAHPNANYPGGDGNQEVGFSANYFGRGNAPFACGNTISGNTFMTNTTDTRNVLLNSYGLVTNNNSGLNYCNIQSAINASQTVNTHVLTVSSGTYPENVTVSKSLTISGAGKGSNPATNTVLTAPSSCAGVGFTISAPNVTVQNMYVTNFQDAVLLNGVVNPTINNMALIDYCRYGVNFGGNNSSIDILLTDIQRTTLLAGTIGMRVGTANAVNGLFMDGCTITGNALQGIVVFQNTTPVAFDDITIQNSTISNNLQKGMYFEKLSNATFEGLTMADNGTDASYNFNNGIDINLKHNAYSNITIQDCDITNSGYTGTATDPENPSAITIKARDDSPSYNTIPASLSNVTIKNNRITGPRNGIRIGEIGKVNATPTNVVFEGNDLSFAFAHKAIISRITSDINVVCNWHGTTDLGTILNTFVEGATGDILLGTVLSSGVDGNVAPGFQPAGSCQCANSNLVTNTNTSETFCDLQSAIDDAQTLDGHTLTVSAGTYVENVIVSKELSILGPNAAIDPCSATPRVGEAIVVPAIAAIASGEIFHVAASNVTISGFTIDGDNTAITSGFSSTNGADIDAAEGITVYETAINNLTASNNIIQNLSYFGLTLYDYPAGVPSTGHTISNNKIQNLGTYDAGSGINLWGGGVLLYNNQYAAVNNNCMTNVRIGVQTGNFSAANPGSSAYAQIDNNTISARRRGIFHNLHYTAASPYTLSNNTITGVEHASETVWDGILLASLSVNSTSSGNTINGAAVTKPSEGYEIWNVKNTSPALISGGSVSNVDIGVFVNNYDGYSSDATDGSHVTVNGLSISPEATGTGIRLFDNPLATSNSNVQATLGAGVVITGGTDGLVIENSTAMVASPLGNVAFSGQSANYIELINNLNNIDATAASFGGVTGGTGTKTQLYDIEDKILHSVDISTLGFVTVKTSNAYVTPNSFDSPTTTTPSVQRAIAAVANPGTVNIEAGNYSPNTMDATGKNITFSPGSSPACIMVGDFTLNPSDVLDMEINGTTPCTGHDQIQVTGTVTLGGATLMVTLGYTPTIGNQITIIDNDDADAVSGQFAQGTSITVGLYTFRIDYAGGTGNDVVLTYCTPTITACPVTRNIEGCSTNAITGPIYSETSANSSEAEFEDLVNMGNVTDPCSIVSVTYIDTKAGTCPIVVTRTWTVTDEAGGTATCTQTINVDDNTPPNFTSCPTTITVNNVPTLCGRSVTYPAPTATDNCTGMLTILKVDGSGLMSGDFFPVGTTLQKFETTDACGNTSTCMFNVVVIDNELPIITGCPTNIIKNTDPGVCTALVTWVAPTASDNCPGVLLTLTPNFPPGSTFPQGVTALQYKATDVSGNMSICNFTVTVNDNQLPQITCPSNVVVNADAGLCSAVVTYTAPVGTDNCPSPMTTQIAGLASGAAFPVGITTNTFKVTDASMNMATCSFTVTVNDNQNPVITDCPDDITVSCAADTTIALTGGPAIATDNCPGVVVTVNEVVTNLTCDHRFTLTRTWIATDAIGNSSTCTQVVTANDQTAPTLTGVPYAGTTGTNACLANAATAAPFNATNAITGYTDNCTGALTATLTDTDVSGTDCAWTVTYTFTISDVCGNELPDQTYSNTGSDQTAPTLTGAPYTGTTGTNACMANAATAAPFNATNAIIGYSDNCLGPVTATLTGTLVTGTDCNWTVTYTFSVLDECNNAFTNRTYSNTGSDQTPPSITCASGSPFTRGTTLGYCGYIVSGTEFNPTASDLCGGPVTITNNFNLTNTLANDTLPTGTTSIIWTATDACGNSSSCTIMVTVNDGENPQVLCKVGTGLDFDGVNEYVTVADNAVLEGMGALTVMGWMKIDALPAQNYAPIAKENAYRFIIGANGSFHFVVATNSNAWYSGGTVGSGGSNLLPTNQWIHLAGVYTGSKVNVYVNGVLMGTSTGTISGNIVNNGSPLTMAFKTAANVDYFNGKMDEMGVFNQALTAAQIKTYLATSLLGSEPGLVAYYNMEQGTGNVVNDNAGTAQNGTRVNMENADWIRTPFGPNNSITVNTDPGVCIAALIFDVAATDNCGVITNTNNFNNTGNASGNYPKGTTMVTWTASDAVPNTGTCSFTVIVEDNEDPIITTCPQLRNIEGCSTDVITGPVFSNISASSTYSEFSGGPNNGVATDNCGITGVNYIDVANGTCPIVVTRTWTILDEADNSATCVQTINVDDTQAPTITTCAVTRNIEGCNTGAISGPAYSETSASSSEAEFEDMTNQGDASDVCGIVTVTYIDVSNGTCPIVVTRTWSLTDACNNTTTCVQTINVDDTQAPTITCALGSPFTRNTTLGYCGYIVSGVEFDATGIDICSGVTITNNFNNTNTLANDTLPTGTTTIIWTATDACGNAESCTIEVTVNDDEDPQVFCKIGTGLDFDGANEYVTVADNAVLENMGALTVMGWVKIDALPVQNYAPIAKENAYRLVIGNNGTYHFVVATNSNGWYTAGTVGGGGANVLPVGEWVHLAGVYTGSKVNMYVNGVLKGTSTGTIAGNIVNNGSPLTMAFKTATNIDYFNGKMDEVGVFNQALTAAQIQAYLGTSLVGSEPGLVAYYNLEEATGSVANDIAGSAQNGTLVNMENSDWVRTPFGPQNSITVDTDPGVCYAALIFDVAAIDNCGVISNVNDFNNSGNASDDYPKGTTVVTWTASDAVPNIGTCSFTVIVEDNEDPIITTCPQERNIEGCSTAAITGPIFSTITSASTYAEFSGVPNNGVATDNCGITGVNYIDVANGTCPIVVTRTWTILDEAGNSATCDQTIYVDDTTDPDVSGCDEDELDATFECAGLAGNESAADDWNATNISYLENCASDVCGNFTVTSDYDFANLSNGCGFSGDITVTYTVTDDCGNDTSMEGTFTIEDNTVPDLSGCDEDELDDTFECAGEAGNLSAANAWNAANITYLEGCADDLCGTITVTSDYDFADLSDGCGFTGNITVTYTVTDECGNNTSTAGTFTIIDTTIPDLGGCDEDELDDTFECAGEAGNLTAANTWNAANITYLEGCADDLCGTITVTSDYDFADLSDGCGFTGSITVTYTVTDECGNNTSRAGTFTIEDTTPPNLVDPMEDCSDLDASDINICLAQAEAFDPNDLIPDVTGLYEDICSEALVTIWLSTDAGMGNTDCAWTFTYNYSITDECGNSSYCSVTYSGGDTEDPTQVCNDITVYLDNTGNYTLTQADIEDIAAGTTDNCTDFDDLDLSVDINDFTCSEVGPNDLVLTVIDLCTNESMCDVVVTVLDTVNPLITCPMNVTLDAVSGSCEQIHSWMIPVPTDACGILSNVVTTSNNTVNVISIPPTAFAVFPVGTTTVTYTATDNNSNTASCYFTVEVIDNQDPIITGCPSNIGPLSNDPGECGRVVSWTAPTASDNCPGVTLEVDPVNANGSLFPLGTTIVTYTATDAGGRTSECSFTVTITDTEAPEIICPADLVYSNIPGECQAEIGYTAPIGTDNCPGAVTTHESGPMTGDIIAVGVHIVVYKVTDDEGLMATCSFTITVTDDEDPVVDCPTDIVVPNDMGECGAEVTFANATATDNCDIDDVVQIAGLPSGSLFPAGVSTITFEATDIHGNTSTCSFTITVNEDEDPQITCPSNIVDGNDPGLCSALVSFVEPTGTDNCPGANTIRTTGQAPNTYFPVGVTIQTYMVTDASGNTATCSFTITINDTEAPQITCPNNIVISNDLGVCGATVTYGTPVGTDNCPGQITVQTAGLASGSVFPVGLTTNTFKVTDAAGTSTTCSFTVTVNDTELPQITCPANIVVSNTTGLCAAVVNYTAPVGTDNCAGQNTVQTAGLASGASFPVGVTVNTFKVTDASGNMATCSFTVTVNDTELPQITCPANISVPNDLNLCTAVVNYTAPVGTDNCPGQNTVQTAGLASGSAFPVGVTVNTFKVTDASGNTATCSFTVTVNDTQLPVITCPSNIGPLSNDPGLCSRLVGFVEPTGTDNCPGANTVRTTGQAPNSYFPVGVTTQTYKVTDASGNTATCSFTITIVDTEAPIIINCPETRAIEGCNTGAITSPSYSATLATTTYAIFNNAPNNGDAIENCAITLVQYQDVASGTCPITVTRTWTISDAAGNSDVCVQTLTVDDTQAPTIVDCSVTRNIEGCDTDDITGPDYSETLATSSEAEFEDANNDGNITDACGITSVTYIDESTGTCPIVVTRTWYIEDACGNESTCTQTITVDDTQAPTISTCPVTRTIEGCGTGSVTSPAFSMSYTVSSYGVFSSAPNNGVATDACGIVEVGYQDVASGECPMTITRTWTLTDACGNTQTCVQIITVDDTQNPTITTCPVARNIEGCGTGAITSPAYSTTWANSTYAVFSSAPNNGVGSDACGIISVTYIDVASGTCPITVTRTWKLTDACNNYVTCDQIITVDDTQKPVITTCPVTRDVEGCNTGALNSPAYSATIANSSLMVFEDMPNFGVASDNCGIVSVKYKDVSTGTCPIVVTRKWYLEDACGNVDSCTQTIYIDDTTPPSLTCPSNIVTSNNVGVCGNNVNFAANATDACGTPVITYSKAPGSYFVVGTTTVYVTATDACGNPSYCNFTVTVNDTTKPTVITKPKTLYLNAVGQAALLISHVNNGSYDNCGIISYSLSKTSFNCSNKGVNIVTLTATDAAGNVGSNTAVVTVMDTTRPVAKCKNITIDLVAGMKTISAAQVNNASTDNCGAPGLSISKSSFSCSDPITNNVVLTATDASGNSSTCIAVVTIRGPITCSITLTPATGANTGGIPNNVYLGYGPQTVLMTAVPSGGTGFNYSWSPTTHLINCTNCQSPTFAPTVAGNFTYTVTVTNSQGCSSTCTVTFCVKDVKVPGMPGKVYVCDNGITKEVAIADVPTYVPGTPGATMGQCSDQCAPPSFGKPGEELWSGDVENTDGLNNVITLEERGSDGRSIKVFPNPTSYYFDMQIFTKSSEKMDMMVYDMYGKMMERRFINPKTESTQFGSEYPAGVYMLQINQGDWSKTVRIIKTNK